MSPSADRRTVLTRGCRAVLVPSGQQVTLPGGTEVVVVQTLGGNVTVQSDRGYLARIAPGDADALGLEEGDTDNGGPESQEPATQAPPDVGLFSTEKVIEALRTVYDPEIPINVVDLGLIYACDATPLADGSYSVEIKMSMTAPGCGMGDVLKEDAHMKVSAVPGVGTVEVELVWDPPWDMRRLSEDARLELGMW